MNAEIQGYADSINGLLTEVEGHIEGLSGDALNWRPLARDTNSLAVIVTHMCGSLGLWVYQTLTGEDVSRVRDSEFQARAQGPDELLTLIALAKSRARTALEGCTAESLNDTVVLPGGEPRTKRSAILTTIEHLSLHLGHMDLTRQLWEAGPGRPD